MDKEIRETVHKHLVEIGDMYPADSMDIRYALDKIAELFTSEIQKARIDEDEIILRLLRMYKRGTIKGDIIDDLETRIKAINDQLKRS